MKILCVVPQKHSVLGFDVILSFGTVTQPTKQKADSFS